MKLTWDEQSLDQEFARLEQELSEQCRGMTVEIWNRILLQTPQYFGRMAASWDYNIGAPNYVDRSEMFEPTTTDLDEIQTMIRSKGHLEAINVSNNQNFGKDRDFRLGDVVYITNGAPHADLVESGQVQLRRVNQPGRAVLRAIDYAEVRFAPLKLKDAARLKNLRIGTL